MIKSWKLFLESYSDEVAAICDKYGITNWSINPDTGLVDTSGGVNLISCDLTKIPLNFGKVNGNFYCSSNELTSLEGCPHTVGGVFYCSDNELTSLEGCPKEVGRDFYCGGNELTSLEGCPKEVGRDFHCGGNNLVSLEGLVGKPSIMIFHADNNPIKKLTKIGQEMVDKNISFIESVIINKQLISDKEFELIFQNMAAQKILDLNDFKIFNTLRTHFPQKYAEVMALRDIDLSADLGELGF